MKLVTINNKALAVPSMWEDVSLKMLVEIQQRSEAVLANDRKVLCEIFTGEDLPSFDVDDEEMNEALSFLLANPVFPHTISLISVRDQLLRVPLVIRIPYESELQQEIAKVFTKEKRDFEHIQDAAFYCACWAQWQLDGVFDIYKAMDLIPEFLAMSMTDVVPLSFQIINACNLNIERKFKSTVFNTFNPNKN